MSMQEHLSREEHQLMLDLKRGQFSSGGELVSTDGKVLPLQSTTLKTYAGAGLARVTLSQTFVNEESTPLLVTYSLPLPADGVVSGFRFLLDGREVRGEVDLKNKARERFEQALVEGRSAALLEQERSNHFTQKVGNIPPHSTIECEVFVDQPLLWLEEGAWEWRFPTVLGPRYMGIDQRVLDAAALQVQVSASPLKPRLQLQLEIEDQLSEGAIPTSPTHEIQRTSSNDGITVSLEDPKGSRLNRDMVVQWKVAQEEVSSSLRVHRPETPIGGEDSVYGLLTLVPPRKESLPEIIGRDLVVLLDTSGSMGGEPLRQAVQVLTEMVQSLEERDRMHLMEFSDRPRSWKKEPVRATELMKAEACEWLWSLEAGGCTEMHEAILEAIRPFRSDSQRQVILVTDGYIGFENEIVGSILDKLPPACRVHTVGVGSSVNRSLTRAAARAGAGVEVLMNAKAGEQKKAVERLLARTISPTVTELKVVGKGVKAITPHALPDLYAGSPATLGLQIQPGTRQVTIEGRMAAGRYRCVLELPEVELGEGDAAIAALFAREQVEDIEARIAATPYKTGDLDRQIETIGVNYQISTRLTSWIAVDTKVSVDVDAPLRSEVMPQEQVAGTQIEAFGLRSSGGFGGGGAALGAQFSTLAGGLAPGGPPPAPLASRSAATGSFPAAPSPKKRKRSMAPTSKMAPPARPAPSPMPPAPPAEFETERKKEEAPQRSQDFVADKADDFDLSVSMPQAGAPVFYEYEEEIEASIDLDEYAEFEGELDDELPMEASVSEPEPMVEVRESLDPREYPTSRSNAWLLVLMLLVILTALGLLGYWFFFDVSSVTPK